MGGDGRNAAAGAWTGIVRADPAAGMQQRDVAAVGSERSVTFRLSRWRCMYRVGGQRCGIPVLGKRIGGPLDLNGVYAGGPDSSIARQCPVCRLVETDETVTPEHKGFELAN